jgi:hypothetical protein
MAAKGSSGGGGALAAVSALAGAALLGAIVWLHGEAGREEEAFDRSKREYREMVDRMKAPVAAYLKGRKGTSTRKASQAQIPASILRVQRNQELKTGGWTERSYTVNLQGTKDAPVSRDAVVNFVRLVETERPAVRVKNLSLAYGGADLASAALTFSAFDRE